MFCAINCIFLISPFNAKPWHGFTLICIVAGMINSKIIYAMGNQWDVGWQSDSQLQLINNKVKNTHKDFKSGFNLYKLLFWSCAKRGTSIKRKVGSTDWKISDKRPIIHPVPNQYDSWNFMLQHVYLNVSHANSSDQCFKLRCLFSYHK